MPMSNGELTVRAKPGAARIIRTMLGLTQGQVVERALALANDPAVRFGQVTASRIERGVPVEYRSVLAYAAALGVDLTTFGVSAKDQAAIAREEAMRLELRARLQGNGDGGGQGRDGTVKPYSDYRAYAGLSGYRNKGPTTAAAAVR